jgi:squalene synthase HpnC
MQQVREENFPVAGLLLHRSARSHLRAIYGFARLVDDVGDELDGNRRAALEQLADDLAQIYRGQQPEHPVMRTLSVTVSECDLPEGPFQRLIEANRRDQVVVRYQTFDELLSYCQLSAAPVGELVLHVFGAASAPRVTLSDSVCAGLQVIEHLQDVAEDYARGRVYLPQEDLARFGCEELDLAARSASPALRQLIALQCARSRGLLSAGTALVPQLSLRPRLAVAGYIGGGRATLSAIEQAGHDVLGQRPRRTRRGFAAALALAVSGR